VAYGLSVLASSALGFTSLISSQILFFACSDGAVPFIAVRHAETPPLLDDSDRIRDRRIKFDHHQFRPQRPNRIPHVIVVAIDVDREQVDVCWNGMAPQQGSSESFSVNPIAASIRMFF
jgi:hypothetical protein